MKSLLNASLALALVFGANTAFAQDAAGSNNGGRLYIVGNALSYGYSLDDARALLSLPETPAVFTGTIYLKANEEFKFLEHTEWGGPEYGVPTTDPISGLVALIKGSNDEGYSKLHVAEDGNYYMVLDTENLTIDINKADYQETQVSYTSLFLVGSATPGNWSVDNGTPLYQSKENPVEYSNAKIALKASPESFKITTAIKGGGSFDSKYYFFRDADDSAKISTDGTDDRQWSVENAADYTVTVNTEASSISIKDNSETAIAEVEAGVDLPAVYYNLQGVRVDNPAEGLYIEVKGNAARKVLVK